MSLDTSRTRFYGATFASDFTGLPVWRIYSEAAAGRLVSRIVGRRVYFTMDDLEEYRERIRRPVDALAAH